MKSPRDWVALLLVPIVVGIIAAVVVAYASTIAPRWFGDKREITVRIAPNIPAVMGPDSAVFYKINVLSSGNTPIRSVPIQIVADSIDSHASLNLVSRMTQPAVEFGRVDEDSSKTSHRFVVDLLNPGDVFEVVVGVKHSRGVLVYAKAEGMKVRTIEPDQPLPKPKPKPSRGFTALFGSVVGAIASFLAFLFKVGFLFGGDSQRQPPEREKPFDRTPIGRKRRNR